MMKIYVDGCSYTAGYGLDSKYSVASLLLDNGSVTDLSRVGKSNYAMALDLYQHKEDFDLYIIGWTFNNRFEFNYDGNVVESSASGIGMNLGNIPNGEFLEKEHTELQRRFFRYSSRLDVLSDYLIDSTNVMIKNKKQIFFSWEKRECITPLIYPKFGKEYRQRDTLNWQQTGHLNESGMQALANIIKKQL